MSNFALFAGPVLAALAGAAVYLLWGRHIHEPHKSK